MRLVIPDLLPGQKYAIEVRANDGVDFSPWSPVFELTTTEDTVTPKVPSNVTWVVSGDSFYGEWDSVELNENSEYTVVTRYELELTGSSQTKIVSVTQQTGERPNYTLSFEANRALFTQPAGTVAMRVRAVDNKGIKSAWSSTISATNPPPGPVTNLAGTSIIDGVNLNWTNPVEDDLLGVNIYASTTENFTPNPSNKVGFTPGTQFGHSISTYTLWHYAVVAVDKFGTESTISRTTGTPESPFVVDTEAPSTPTALAATLTNNSDGKGGTADISWTMANAPSDLSSFNVRWREVGGNWNQTTVDRDSRQLSTPVAKAYTSYEFQIRAYDFSANYSAWSSTVTANAPANTAPAKTTGVSVAAGVDSLNISWTESTALDVKSGAGTYEVQVATNSSFSPVLVSFKTGATSLAIGGMSPNTTYYTRVRAIDSVGLNGTFSDTVSKETTSFPLTPKTDGFPPSSSPTPTVTPDLGSLMVRWSPVTTNSQGDTQEDLVTYEVHISATSGFTASGTTKVTEVAGTSASINTLGNGNALNYGTPYYVKIIAKDLDGPASVSGQGSGSPKKVTAGDSSLTAGDVGAPTSGEFSTLSGTVNTSIKSSVNEYSVHSSETVAPTGGWSTSTPTRTPGTFVWFRTKVTYNNNNSTTTNPALLTGNTGAQGDQGTKGDTGGEGPKGDDGTDGISIDSVTPYFRLENTGATKPGVPTTATPSGWSTLEPDYVSGKELYRTEKIVYSDATFDYTLVSKVSSYTAAQSAMTTANGKNKIITSTGDATGTSDANGLAFVTGDTWFKKNALNRIVAQWEYVEGAGNGWIPKTLDDAIIANLNVGKLVSGDIDSAIITIKDTGEIKSSDYSGSAGWRISNAGGIELRKGTVYANTLESGTGIVKNLIISSGGAIRSAELDSDSGFIINNNGIELRDANSKVTASALTTGTLGSSTGVINIEAGASIVMTGGYIKSVENTGTNLDTAETSGTGFFLNSEGLFIGGDSKVMANALASDTLESTIITLGNGGRIESGSWYLDNNGLFIPDGGITAKKLKLQNGVNIMPGLYSSFTASSRTYSNQVVNNNSYSLYVAAGGMITGQGTSGKFSGKSLGTVWSTNSVNPVLYLGLSNTDYNIPVEDGKTYIFSTYAWAAGTVATNLQMKIRWSNGTITTPTVVSGQTVNTTLAANGSSASATRLTGYATAPAGVTGAVMIFESSTRTANAGYNVDGIQVEEKLTDLNTPSSWTPGSNTEIVGGQLSTGEIVSNQEVVVMGETIPAWSININGYATFAGANILGNTVLGAGENDDTSYMQSSNYEPGSRGWKISSSGEAEFRDVVSNSLSGDAIIGSSLSVSKLSAGTLTDEIILENGSSLVSRGDMGEKVGLGSYGFAVNGPQENPVTFKYSSGTTRTLTTALEHQFIATDSGANPPVVGSKIRVAIGDTNYDGVFTVTSKTAYAFSYVASSSYSQTTTAVSSGMVQGANPSLPDGPRYIYFPTDGTQPNIISGELTSSSVIVTEGMSIRKASSIEQGAVLTINSVTEGPTAAPAAEQSYSDVKLKGYSGSLLNFTVGNGGNYFVLAGGTNEYQVTEHNSTGSLVATRKTYSSNTTFVMSGHGLEWTSSYGGRYYVYRTQSSRMGVFHYIDVYNNSWALQGTYEIPLNPPPAIYAQIGWDYTNNRLMLAYRGGDSSGYIDIRYFTMNATTGIPTGQAASDTRLFSYEGSDGTISYVGRGSFDFGVDRVVVKNKKFSSSGSKANHQFAVSLTTGASDETRNWPVANESSIAGAAWDTANSKFVDLSTSGVKRQYEGGDSFWLSTTMTDARWLRYSWYRQDGNIESNVSPEYKIDLIKRARLSATIAPVPYSASGTNTPDKARVYVLDNPTDTYPTLTNYRLRVTVDWSSQQANINPNSLGSAGTATTTNGFAGLTGDPGKIQSSTGKSFWLGDDTAQFSQLVLVSTEEANFNGGNKPALRIGDINNQHLRIDSNEIVAMESNTSRQGGELELSADTVRFNVVGGALSVTGGSNYLGKVRTTNDNGTAFAFMNNRIVATTATFDSGNTTSSNTVSLQAGALKSYSSVEADSGLFDTGYSGGGSSSANINNSGRVIRAGSSERYKKYIKPLEVDVAKKALDLEAVSFVWRAEHDMGEDRVPGFIAEQAEEAGMGLWVTYNKDGQVDGFRYAELTAAHNVLIKGLHEENEDLKTRLSAAEEKSSTLESRLAALEERLDNMVS